MEVAPHELVGRVVRVHALCRRPVGVQYGRVVGVGEREVLCRRGQQHVGVTDHVVVVAREESDAGAARRGGIPREVEFGLVVVAAAAYELHSLLEVLQDVFERLGGRFAVVMLDDDRLRFGYIGDARIGREVVRVEEVGEEGQQAEVRVGAGQQRFALLQGGRTGIGQLFDGFERVVGHGDGVVGRGPVLLVGVVARFRAGELVPEEGAHDVVERRVGLHSLEGAAEIGVSVAAVLDERHVGSVGVGRGEQLADLFRRVDGGAVVGHGVQELAASRRQRQAQRYEEYFDDSFHDCLRTLC